MSNLYTVKMTLQALHTLEGGTRREVYALIANDLIGLPQAANLLGDFDYTTLVRAAADGSLNVIIISGRMFVEANDLSEWYTRKRPKHARDIVNEVRNV